MEIIINIFGLTVTYVLKYTNILLLFELCEVIIEDNMYRLKLFLIQQINIVFLIVVNFRSLNTTYIMYIR